MRHSFNHFAREALSHRSIEFIMYSEIQISNSHPA
jgi:hypothetical protein